MSNSRAKRTIYGIHNEEQMYATLEEAEDYLLKNYPEYCGTKDATMDFLENMIYEELV